MDIYEYNHYEHKPIIDDWFTQHGISLVDRSEIPDIGFIAFYGMDAVAAIFLRRGEAKLAIIDGLIANPKCDKDVRSDGIDAVTERVLLEARSRRFTKVLCWTDNSRTLKRAKDFGFVAIPETLLIKQFYGEE